MNIFHVIRGFGSLSLAKTTQPKQVVVLPKPLVFEIEPLTSYCINHPKLSDLIVYKVPLRVHPWGVNFILVKPQIYHCNFNNFCFCVKKMKCVMKAYVHMVVGGYQFHCTNQRWTNLKRSSISFLGIMIFQGICQFVNCRSNRFTSSLKFMFGLEVMKQHRINPIVLIATCANNLCLEDLLI